MKMLKRLLLGALLLVVVKVGAFFYLQNQASAATPSNSDLEQIVAIANKRYPRETTPGIRIERMTSGPRLVTYHKTILNRTVDEFDQTVDLRPGVAAEFCDSVAGNDFLRKGISMQVIFRDKNGALVYDHMIRPSDCR